MILKELGYGILKNKKMSNKINNFSREIYNKVRNHKIYPYLKKTGIRKAYLVVQDLHGRYDLTFGKKIILHGDLILREAFRLIGKKAEISSFIETGTSLGYTTKFLAENFPDANIYSCEIAKPVFLKAKKNLQKFKNIKLYPAGSIDFLKYLLKENLGYRPLFFLDAHGVGKCPLDEEIRIISKNLKSAVMIIDDFKVDNESFEFDSYEDGEVSLKRVILNINKKKKYNVLFPNYDEKQAFRKQVNHKNLRGYAIIFQNMEKEFKNILKEDFIKKYFSDKSHLTNISANNYL